MNFVGIPCRHIICVAVQLNLESLPTLLFLNRWCKDPNKNALAQHYTSFYNRIRASTTSTREEHSQTEYDLQNNKEYQLFLLNRTLRKIKRYAKLPPGVVNFFSTKLEEVLENVRSVVQLSVHTSPEIYNSSIVKTKGRACIKMFSNTKEISSSQKCTLVCGSCNWSHKM